MHNARVFWFWWTVALIVCLAYTWYAHSAPTVPVVIGAAPVATSPASAVALAAADAIRLPEHDRRFYRYFWDPSRDENFSLAYGLHLNLLSDQPFLVLPVEVVPGLLRIDTRDYGHDKRLDVFERFAGLDIFFHEKAKAVEESTVKTYWPGGKWDADDKTYESGMHPYKVPAGHILDVAATWTSAPVEVSPNKFEAAIDVLRRELITETPILNAQWHFAQTARATSIRNRDEKVGYYQWLGIKDRDSFFALTGVDRKVATALFAEHRAVVLRSGIGQQNRQVVRLGSTAGGVWGTLDPFDQSGRGVARRNLRDGEFVHNAERWYGPLPNGLFATLLSSAKGDVQASAPDQIGPDDSPLNTSRDFRVHANLSCIRCHGQSDWLRPIDDWARTAFRAGGALRFQEAERKVFVELGSQYLRDLNGLLVRDRAGYAAATMQVTSRPGRAGLTSARVAAAYARAWDDYVQRGLLPSDAARELGVSEQTWLSALRRYSAATGKADLVLSDHLDDPPRPIPRLDWESSYAFAQSILTQYPVEQAKKVKSAR